MADQPEWYDAALDFVDEPEWADEFPWRNKRRAPEQLYPAADAPTAPPTAPALGGAGASGEVRHGA